MFNLTHGQHFTQHFGDFYRSGTYQHRTSCLNQLFDFLDHGFIFFALSLVNTVVHVFAGNRTVGRDYHNIQFINVPKFACFRLGSTGHTGQLVIHTEVVLQSNRGESLRSSFHFHAFLCFDSLMQSVRIAAAFHDTSGLFVYNLHLSVDNHILVIFLEHRVRLQ